MGIQNLIEHTCGKFDKGLISAMADQLCRKDILQSKQIGSSLVYWPGATEKAVSSDDVEAMRREKTVAETAATKVENECARALGRAKSLKSEPINVDEALQRVRCEVERYEASLYRTTNTKASASAKLDARKNYTLYRKHWITRKRAYKDCLETLADALQTKPKQILSEVQEYSFYDTHPADDENIPPALQ